VQGRNWYFWGATQAGVHAAHVTSCSGAQFANSYCSAAHAAHVAHSVDVSEKLPGGHADESGATSLCDQTSPPSAEAKPEAFSTLASASSAESGGGRQASATRIARAHRMRCAPERAHIYLARFEPLFLVRMSGGAPPAAG